MNQRKISILSLLCALPLMACNTTGGKTTETMIPANTFFAVAKKAGEVTASASSFGYELTAEKAALSANQAWTASDASFSMSQKLEMGWTNVLAQGATTGFGEKDTVRKASHVLQANGDYSNTITTSVTSLPTTQTVSQELDLGAYIEDKALYLYANHGFAANFSSPWAGADVNETVGPLYAMIEDLSDLPSFVYDTSDYAELFSDLEEKFNAMTTASSLDAQSAWLASVFSFSKQDDEYAITLHITNDTKNALFSAIADEMKQKDASVDTADLSAISNVININAFLCKLTLNEQGFGALTFNIDMKGHYETSLKQESQTMTGQIDLSLVLKGNAKFGYNVTPKDKPEGNYVSLNTSKH